MLMTFVAAAFATAAAGQLVPDATGGEAAAQSGGRPNVVVVMTDDQDPRSVRYMSNVKRLLVRGGTTFRRSFATLPSCCPSRATFLTGQYAHNHGVMASAPPLGGFAAFDPRSALPVALRRGGYRTGYVGRYLNGYNELEVPPGWVEWQVPLGAGAFRMYGYWLNQNGTARRYGSKARHYQTDVYAEGATRFIRRSSRRVSPFFLTFAPLAPHGEPRRGTTPNPRPAPRHRGMFGDVPLPRPASFNEADVSDKPPFVRDKPRLTRTERRALERRHRDRLASLQAVDEGVAGIVAELRRAGELRNTLIIFTSDNGYLLGEHRLTGKRVLYEESARVPLIVRGPRVPSDVRRAQIVGNIDLAPTILSAAGVAPLLTMDGRSLIPLARRPSGAGRRDILLENPESVAVRTRRHMYADHGEGEHELYEMITDPFQLQSRAGDSSLADVQSRLARRLDVLRHCAGAECR